MTAADLRTALTARGVTVAVVGDRLRYTAPPGGITPELLSALRRQKSELIALQAAEAHYDRLYWGTVHPLMLTQAAALDAGDTAEAARLRVELQGWLNGAYAEARNRYRALLEEADGP